MTQPADLDERAHQQMLQKHESRRRFEEEQLKQLREKKRLAEAAGARRPGLGVVQPADQSNPR
jgi:hypothetical protein